MCIGTSEVRRGNRIRVYAGLAGGVSPGILEREQGQQDERGQHADLQEYRGEYGTYPGAFRLFHENEPCGDCRYAQQDEENDGGERGQGTPVGDDDAQAGESVQKEREKVEEPFHGEGFCRVSSGRCAVSGGGNVVSFARGTSVAWSGTGVVVKCSHVVRAMAAIIFSVRALGS